MDKTLKYSIAIGIIIIALSFGYYLVIFLPKKEAMKLELQKQEAEQQQQDQKLKEKKEKIDKDDAKIAIEKCFSEVDEQTIESAKSWCKLNSKEVGDDGLCAFPREMHEYFDNRAKNEKDLCLKKYPQ